MPVGTRNGQTSTTTSNNKGPSSSSSSSTRGGGSAASRSPGGASNRNVGTSSNSKSTGMSGRGGGGSAGRDSDHSSSSSSSRTGSRSTSDSDNRSRSTGARGGASGPGPGGHAGDTDRGGNRSSGAADRVGSGNSAGSNLENSKRAMTSAVSNFIGGLNQSKVPMRSTTYANVTSAMSVRNQFREDMIDELSKSSLGAYPTALSGVLGRVQAESQFDVFAHNPLDPGVRGSIGALQWNKSRIDNLDKFAEDNQLDPMAARTQARFIEHELTFGEEKGAWNKIKKATTPEEAARIAGRVYARPANDPKNPGRKLGELTAMDAARDLYTDVAARSASRLNVAGVADEISGSGRTAGKLASNSMTDDYSIDNLVDSINRTLTGQHSMVTRTAAPAKRVTPAPTPRSNPLTDDTPVAQNAPAGSRVLDFAQKAMTQAGAASIPSMDFQNKAITNRYVASAPYTVTPKAGTPEEPGYGIDVLGTQQPSLAAAQGRPAMPSEEDSTIAQELSAAGGVDHLNVAIGDFMSTLAGNNAYQVDKKPTRTAAAEEEEGESIEIPEQVAVSDLPKNNQAQAAAVTDEQARFDQLLAEKAASPNWNDRLIASVFGYTQKKMHGGYPGDAAAIRDKNREEGIGGNSALRDRPAKSKESAAPPKKEEPKANTEYEDMLAMLMQAISRMGLAAQSNAGRARNVT